MRKSHAIASTHEEAGMSTLNPVLPAPELQEFLAGRHIATIGTENEDGSIHLTAVWYVFEEGSLFVAEIRGRSGRSVF
jgi:hypothetical protein